MSDQPTLPSIADAEGVAPIPRKRVWAWALWDWATQPFNTVIITFVFTALYLTKDSFIDPEIAALGKGAPEYDAAIDQLTSGLGWGLTAGGILIAVLAPVLGQRADATGRRKAWLGWMTLLLVGAMLGLYFVEASPDFFWLGVGLIGFGAIVGEVAGVNYNAMIVEVSTPSTMGRVSGLGWGLGYMGGIVALVIVVVLDLFDWFGMDTSNGMAYRLIAVGCAVWTVAFAWPLFVHVPEAKASERPRVGLIQGYAVLWSDLRELWRDARGTLWFLLSSAVYRDGLAGVFTFGAVIAAVAFDFSDQEVIIFGIAANLIAGLSTIVAGRFDDRLGPRIVILAALGTIVVSGIVIVILHTTGAWVFWLFGLLLSACVGPAQAASRSLLARVAPSGREAEVFGLYATTGRAASFMAPAMWAGTIALLGGTIWGTLGVIAVVAAGMVLLMFVRTPADKGARVDA
ncbi:MFS transporter [Demequina sp. SYSU T00039]|uniref:MFS transporter n=1 Tax=Demequina lignilytica TaxID=3051663 RepID=A0AAW7M0C6_9MICO|nr:MULTISPECIES: MFS transporter [unclassified Demequina]MDN4477799.1 MFS transporter [Demequina sp. SYSU T00039-1]MDN4487708.1 MFS transporter [Demequina sp. SYSU T00039]